MKIAVYSTPIFKVPVPGYSGLEVIAYEQAKGLAARGHDVLLIAPDGSTCPGVQIVPCGPAGQMDEKMAYGGCPEHKDGDKVLRRAHAGCWQALLGVDVVLDHSIAGDEHLLVRIDGVSRWTSFEQLFGWAMSRGTPIVEKGSIEVCVRGLEVPSAVGIHKIKWKAVNSVIRHVRKDSIHEVRTEGGFGAVVTNGHSIIVAGRRKLESIRADESVGKFAAVARRIPCSSDDRISWPVTEAASEGVLKGWNQKHAGVVVQWPVSLSDADLVLLGLWVGDGCYNEDSSVLLASGTTTKHIAEEVASEFDAVCKIDPKWPDVKHCINSTLLVWLMKASGFMGHSDTKTVPDWVFDLSRRQIGLFLRGYFSADGHAGRRVCVNSVNGHLIRQISVLMAMCGIRHCVSLGQPAVNPFSGDVGNPMWEITVPNDQYVRFVNRIGFVQEDRNTHIINKSLTRRSWRGDVPYCLVRQKKLRFGSREQVLSLTKLAKKKGIEVADEFAASAISWRKVLKSTPTSRTDRYVYDLSVPGTENFFVGLMCCHNSWSKRSYALKAEGRLKAPVLGWMHAPVNTMFGSWPPAFPRLPVVDRACPVCISKDQASHFRALHNRDVRVCYNGFDPEVYKPIPGIKRTDRFLFMGRFSTVKSPHIAIEACLKAGVGLDVVGDRQITGEPHYYDHCTRLAQQQSPGWDAVKWGKQIVVHPGCTRGETVTWYSRAHVFLHSAKDFREPFGLAPVEAQACGLPVICFDNGALRETVVQDWTGAICKTEDEFLQAITSPWLFNFDETGRAECRKNALRFTVENMINRVEELCHEAVKTGGW